MGDKLALDRLDPTGRQVLMRVDFNVPLDADRMITDDTRIRAALPSLRYIVENGGRLVLMSHLGRPRGKIEPTLSLRPVADRLAELVAAPVKFASDTVGPDAESRAAGLEAGEILVIENLRFCPGETENDPGFAQGLAALGDVYVNDAFGTAHRAHASTVGVAAHFDRRYAGFLMAEELRHLGKLIAAPDRPFVAVLGGAKVKDKVKVIRNLLDVVDTLLLGGGMVFTFFAVHGLNIGESLVDEESFDVVREINEAAAKSRGQLVLPTDCVVSTDFSDRGQRKTVLVTDIPDGWQGLDIGPETEAVYGQTLSNARSIFWNGPMGVFEIPVFARGTRAVAEAIAAATADGAVSVVGGGDSASAVAQFELSDRISHVSTGGGASLVYMAGEELPGVAALSDA
jgi:phosphoglycerate kinase